MAPVGMRQCERAASADTENLTVEAEETTRRLAQAESNVARTLLRLQQIRRASLERAFDPQEYDRALLAYRQAEHEVPRGPPGLGAGPGRAPRRRPSPAGAPGPGACPSRAGCPVPAHAPDALPALAGAAGAPLRVGRDRLT